jgi:hypothetical protein
MTQPEMERNRRIHRAYIGESGEAARPAGLAQRVRPVADAWAPRRPANPDGEEVPVSAVIIASHGKGRYTPARQAPDW